MDNTKYYMHEKYLCRAVLHITSPDSLSRRETFSKILKLIQNGNIPNGDGSRWHSPINPIPDIMNEAKPNEISLWYRIYGSKESFPTSNLSTSNATQKSPRWIIKGEHHVDFKYQIGLIKSCKDRSNLISWCQGLNTEGSNKFEKNDLPDIAKEFFPTTNDLKIVAKEIKECLIYSNIYQPRTSPRRKKNTELSSSTAQQQDTLSTQVTSSSSSPPQSPMVSTRNKEKNLPHESRSRVLPDALKLKSLKCDDGSERKLRELACIEFTVTKLIEHNKNQENSSSPSPSAVMQPPPQDKLPTTISFNKVSQLSLLLLDRARRNVAKAREDFLNHYFSHGLFKPQKDQYLLDWMDHGKNYSKGDRLPTVNTEVHQSSHQLSFTDYGMAIIRHIIFVHKIPITRFPSLMNAFAVLFLGRVLHLNEFPSHQTLPRRLLRLDAIDWYYFVDKFRNYIQNTNSYGFPRYWYLMVDDSKLFKVNRHAVHMSAIDDDGNPCYKLITTSAAVTKDSDGNSNLNYKMLIEKLPPEILSHYGGNVSDHASDALKEGRMTFEKVMNYIEEKYNSQREQHDSSLILSKVINGVDRKIIQLGDPFHIDNLAVNAASIAAFGDTEKDNHRQIHHCQLLQSLHDLFSQDRIGMQEHMEIILGGQQQLKIKTMRERIQRWLVNQRNASWVLEALSIKLDDGSSALIQWARRIEKYTASSVVRQIARDVATMLIKPEIITGLYFESALGSYFEITLQWHAMPGELSERSGFRMMELHLFWFEFIMPWWQSALTKPESHFKEMFNYINSHVKEDDDTRKLKIQQVKVGIQAGYNQIIKMTEMLFSPPNIFLVMIDPSHCGSFVRSLLSLVVLEGGVKIGMEMEELQKRLKDYSTFDSWPSSEKEWYTLLKNCGVDSIVHYFKMIGLSRQIVYGDFIKMSTCKDVNNSSQSSVHASKLSSFKELYPVIYAAFDAVFFLMPSNNRMSEQSFGGLRDSLRAGVSYAFTDAHRSYITNIEYHYREKRRMIVRKHRAAKTRHKQPGEHIQKRRKLHTHTETKHDRSKDLQQMIGKQLIEFGSRYSKESIDKIPKEVMKNIGVKKISQKGITYLENNLVSKKMEAEEKRLEKSRYQPLTEDQYIDKASRTPVDNDLKFESIPQDEIERRADLDTLCKIGFWKGVPVTKDKTLHKTVKMVFPYFWKDEMMNMTKKALCPELKSYLEKVCNIANGEEEYDFSSTSTSSMICGDNYYGKLEYFIKYQRTTILSEKRENKKRFGKAMQAIFESNGTEIANRQRYKIDSDKQIDDNVEQDDTLNTNIDEDEENQVEL